MFFNYCPLSLKGYWAVRLTTAFIFKKCHLSEILKLTCQMLSSINRKRVPSLEREHEEIKADGTRRLHFSDSLLKEIRSLRTWMSSANSYQIKTETSQIFNWKKQQQQKPTTQKKNPRWTFNREAVRDRNK